MSERALLMRPLRSVPGFIVIFLLTALTATLCAQAPSSSTGSAQSPAPAGSGTLLRTTSNLVLLDVMVTEKDKAVRGLDRSRFHLFQDGKEQAIRSFDEHRPPDTAAPGSVPKLKRASLPPHTYTNIPEFPDSSAVTVLLLDALNTSIEGQLNVRHQMIDYMGKIKPGTSLAIFTLSSRLRMVTNFSTDMDALGKLLKSPKATGQQPLMAGAATLAQQTDTTTNLLAATSPVNSPSNDALAAGAISGTVNGPIDAAAALQQFQADTLSYQADQRVRITLDAFRQLARSLSAIPGRKNVIWFSSSFPFVIDPDPSLYDKFGAARTYMDDVRQTTKILSDARVAIDPIDARGLMAPSQSNASVAGPQANSAYMQEREQVVLEQDAMRQVAADTGGKAYVDTNEFGDAVADIVEAGSSYYTLSFVPARNEFDGEFHRFKVRLDNASYKLTYRSGYFADPPDKPSPHRPGETNMIALATVHGAPPATQISFDARVLPATDPLLKGAKLIQGPVGDAAATLKGTPHRYVVDLVVDLHGIAFDTAADGVHQAYVEFALVAFDADGNRVNYLEHGFQLAIRPDRFASLLASGIPVRMEIDLPAGQDSLRIGIHDVAARRTGSLEVPVTVSPN